MKGEEKGRGGGGVGGEEGREGKRREGKGMEGREGTGREGEGGEGREGKGRGGEGSLQHCCNTLQALHEGLHGLARACTSPCRPYNKSCERISHTLSVDTDPVDRTDSLSSLLCHALGS